MKEFESLLEEPQVLEARKEIDRLRKESETEKAFTNKYIKFLHAAEQERDGLLSKLQKLRAELLVYSQADVSNSYATTKAVCLDLLEMIDAQDDDDA